MLIAITHGKRRVGIASRLAETIARSVVNGNIRKNQSRTMSGQPICREIYYERRPMISYGNYRLESEGGHRFLCRQELGSLSLYSMDGTFDKVIEYIKQEKEYYQQYLDGMEVEDHYLEAGKGSNPGWQRPVLKKFVKFLEIQIDYNSYSSEDGPQLIVYGLRELDEAEKAFKEAEDKASAAKRDLEKREQYEKLKKEFETGPVS